MKIRLLFILSFVLLFSNLIFSQTASLPSKFQSWNEVQLIILLVRGKDAKSKTIDKLTATFNGTLRFGRSNLDFLDNRLGVAIDFRVNHHLILLTNVLYRKDEIVKNVRRYETRFDVGATVFKTWREFSIRDRNMYEHRFRNGRANLELYRNRIQISHPLNYKDKEIFSPFISEEGYFDLKTNRFIINEFYAGITRRLNHRTTLDIAYLRNDQRPVNVNGLSINLKFKLR